MSWFDYEKLGHDLASDLQQEPIDMSWIVPHDCEELGQDSETTDHGQDSDTADHGHDWCNWLLHNLEGLEDLNEFVTAEEAALLVAREPPRFSLDMSDVDESDSDSEAIVIMPWLQRSGQAVWRPPLHPIVQGMIDEKRLVRNRSRWDGDLIVAT